MNQQYDQPQPFIGGAELPTKTLLKDAQPENTSGPFVQEFQSEKSKVEATMLELNDSLAGVDSLVDSDDKQAFIETERKLQVLTEETESALLQNDVTPLREQPQKTQRQLARETIIEENAVNANGDNLLAQRKKAGFYLHREVFRYLKDHLSDTLRQNPQAELNPYHEITQYLSKQDLEHMEQVRALAEQIQIPPSPNTKAVICIPVAGHQEGQQIYASLENYTMQNFPKDQFEIILFVNRPEVDREGFPISPDETMNQINLFQKNYPDMPIRVMEKVLPLHEAKIGTVRKYISDVVLYRQQMLGQEAPDVIIMSNDADNKGISLDYIKTFIETFKKNPKAEAVLGQIDWDPQAYAEYPLVHIGTRLFQYLNIIGRHKTGRMVTSGAKSAYKASIYGAVGGYNTELETGEDVGIGKAILIARQKDASRVIAAPARASRMYTSARRAIDTLQKGLTPVQQCKGFSAFDDEVRKLQLGNTSDIDYGNQEEMVRLQEGLTWVINQTLDVYTYRTLMQKDNPLFQQGLRFLGIQSTLGNDGNVVITNMDTIAKRLQQYKDIAVLQRDIKSGKDTDGTLLKKLKVLQNIETAQAENLMEDVLDGEAEGKIISTTESELPLE